MLNLANDNLVIIADGTYCAMEKSANNDFQYKTYSGQKKDSLFKPFILCCADGYIVDCYGPFAANENDALILDYVLKCLKMPQQVPMIGEHLSCTTFQTGVLCDLPQPI